MAISVPLSESQTTRLRGKMAQVVIVICAGCDADPLIVLGTQSLIVSTTAAVQAAIELGWANQPTLGGWFCPNCKEHEAK